MLTFVQMLLEKLCVATHETALSEGNLVHSPGMWCLCIAAHPPLPFPDIYSFVKGLYLLRELPLFSHHLSWLLLITSDLCTCACRIVLTKGFCLQNVIVCSIK